MKTLIYTGMLAVMSLGPIAAYYSSEETIEITINDKERITTGSGEHISSKFIVYGENEVFENTDSWLYLKFNSSDVQNKINVGETYKVKVVGWRVPFISWYRNIVTVY